MSQLIATDQNLLQPTIEQETSGAQKFLNAILVLGCVVGFAAAATCFESAIHIPGALGFAGALVICAIGIVAALLSANVHHAARHLYNAHYAILPGTLGIIWPLQFVGQVNQTGEIHTAAIGALALSGPWIIMHLLVSSTCRRSRALMIGAASVAIGFAALHPASLLTIAALATAPILAAWFFVTPESAEESPEPVASKSWGVISFLLFNLVAISGFGVMLALFMLRVYAVANDEMSEAAKGMLEAVKGAEFSLITTTEGLVKLAGARLAASIAAAAIVPAFVFLWPVVKPNRWTVGLACACAVLAASLGGQPSLAGGLGAGVVSILLLSISTIALATESRARRAPIALIASAIAATILMQNFSGVLDEPSPALATSLIETVYLGVFWEFAYFLGVRVIRNRDEVAAGFSAKSI